MRILSVPKIPVGIDPGRIEPIDGKQWLNDDIGDGKITDFVGIIGVKIDRGRCGSFSGEYERVVDLIIVDVVGDAVDTIPEGVIGTRVCP